MFIEAKNVTYYYNYKKLDEHKALEDVSFNIEKGDFLAIVGKTGSGKSTLVQCLNALSLPTDGYIKVDNFYITGNKKLKKELLKTESKDIKKLNKKLSLLKKDVGLVFQFPEYQLFKETVLKDVMYGPLNFKMSEEDAKKAAIDALKSVGIDESYFERSPFELSGGEKRRVAIAGILASNPKILILDEPTAGLDPKGKKDIMDLIKKIHEEGTTIILVTHDMNVVMEYSKKVLILKDGKILKMSTPIELFNDANISEYSLEIPTLYKFKNLLKNKRSAGFFDKISSFDELIDCIVRYKND